MRTIVPVALAALVFSSGCQVVAVDQPLPSPTMAASSAPRPAGPYLSPAGELEAKLRTVAPNSFAGLTLEGGDRRSLVVYTTVIEPALTDAIAEVQASTRGGLTVRVVAGLKNSLATLELVRDQITARARDLHAQGVNLTSWGADIVTNRVLIGVHGLTAKISADLTQEFGADLILVVEREYFHTT